MATLINTAYKLVHSVYNGITRPVEFLAQGVFFSAIERSDLTTVRRMLDAGFDPVSQYARETSLFCAVKLPDSEMLNLLVERIRHPIDLERSGCNLALQWAARHGHTEKAKILIQKLAPHQMRDARVLALKERHSEIVEAIDMRRTQYEYDREKFIAFVSNTHFSSIQEEPGFSELLERYGFEKILVAIFKLENDSTFQKLCNLQSSLKNTILFVQEILEKDKLTLVAKTKDFLNLYSPEFKTLSQEKQASICEYLRRVEKYELVHALLKMNRLPALTEDQFHALKRQNWSHSIFEDPNLQEYALRAFISGKLDVSEISEIFIYDECMRWDANSNQARMIPFVNQNRTRNDEAVHILEQAMKKYYTKADIATFLGDPELQNAQIYLIPIIPSSHERCSIVNVLTTRFNFTFLTYEDKGIRYCVVMSYKLISKLYYSKFGPQTPSINAVIGSSVAFTNFTDPSKRDVQVPCHLFPDSHVKKADGFPASPLEFWYHDAAFHVYLSSLNPHRAAYLELAHLFKDAPSESERQLYIKLLDQAFLEYIYAGSANDAFRKTLDLLSKHHSEPFQIIMAHLLANKKRWKEKYNITLPEGTQPSLAMRLLYFKPI